MSSVDTSATSEAAAITCLNCGTVFVGDYCNSCGQAAKEPRRFVIGLVQDVFVETINIDSKLLRSIRSLLFRPGMLARRYIDGKRASHSTPFRMFLFTSVFFFIAAFWLFERSGAMPEGPIGDNSEIVDIQTSDDESDFSDAPEWLIPHLEKLEDAAERLEQDPRLFYSQVKTNLPRALFAAPVVFTLITGLLYIYRRKFVLYDHLVIALYMHAALYAYLLLAMLLALIPGFEWLASIPLVWGGLQSLLMFRQAYQSNWFSVVLKWMILNVSYFIALTMIISFGFIAALYQS
ncbi:MAG: DUF3667 domain-containing protein [Pseudomonadota bacterium]